MPGLRVEVHGIHQRSINVEDDRRDHGLSKSGEAKDLLSPAHQGKDEDDDENQTQSATWVIAPASAIRPGWQSTNQQQDENDNQNRIHSFFLLEVRDHVIARCAGIFVTTNRRPYQWLAGDDRFWRNRRPLLR